MTTTSRSHLFAPAAPDPSLHTIGLAEWEMWQYSQRLSDRTLTERIRVIRLMHAETGIQPAHAEPMDIMRWCRSHDGDWSDSTAATYQSYLSSWFKWLQLSERRDDNPMLKVGRAKYPDREPRPIADSDVPKLLGSRMRFKTRAMILLMLLAGLRVHEVAKVRGEDFDLAAGLLWVKGKGRKLKSVPLHPVLTELSCEMPERGWWFPFRGNESEHVAGRTISDVVSRTMRRAGVRGTPHALRHWYGSTLLDNGTDIRVVQELMRHKTIQSTQIYTRVPDRRRRAAIAELTLVRDRNPALSAVPIRPNAA